MVELKSEQCGTWAMPALRYTRESAFVKVQVLGLIGNSIATSKPGQQRTAAWKIAVAEAVRRSRGDSTSMLDGKCAVTLGMSFHVPSHGGQALDIENFLKPAFDALACGLFIAADHDLSTIARWHFDDSSFVHLLIHRLPDATSPITEGAAFMASCAAQ